VAVTIGTVLSAIGGIGSGTNTIAPWASSFKINRIRIWASPEDASAVTTNILWTVATAHNVKDEVKDRTIPSSAGVIAALEERPPKNSLASFWLDNGASGTLFQLSIAKGSVIDLHVSFTLANGFAATSQSAAGASAGGTYYTHLDGVGGVLNPVGRHTIL
jgi:hypothetical protein